MGPYEKELGGKWEKKKKKMLTKKTESASWPWGEFLFGNDRIGRGEEGLILTTCLFTITVGRARPTN